MFLNHYPTPQLPPPPPPPGYMFTYQQQGMPGVMPSVQHSTGQYVMQSGPEYQHPGQYIYQYPQPQIVQAQSPPVSHIQAPPDILPQMPITPSQHHTVTQQVTPSQPVQTPSPCVTPSPGALLMVMPQTSSNKTKPEETPKHDSEKEEETLAEPLKTETDDENCVYFKISKSDINKPEIVKLLTDALSDEKEDAENSSSKVTSSEVPDQM